MNNDLQKLLNYRNDGFWISDNKNIVFHDHKSITHVIPITEPEAPK